MRSRVLPLVVLVAVLALTLACQESQPTANAAQPAYPTLGIGLRYRFPSHGLQSGTAAVVTVDLRRANGTWVRVYGPASHDRGFRIGAIDGATYRVTGVLKDRDGRVWVAQGTTQVHRNQGYVGLLFGR